jgi:hypothetical protein
VNIDEISLRLNPVWEFFSGLSLVERVLIATSLAIATLAAGWKPVLSFYRWCVDKYDSKVLGFFRESLRKTRLNHPTEYMTLGPITEPDLANAIHRRYASVCGSLRRLEVRGLVKEVRSGWVLIDQDF